MRASPPGHSQETHQNELKCYQKKKEEKKSAKGLFLLELVLFQQGKGVTGTTPHQTPPSLGPELAMEKSGNREKGEKERPELRKVPLTWTQSGLMALLHRPVLKGLRERSSKPWEEKENLTQARPKGLVLRWVVF